MSVAEFRAAPTWLDSDDLIPGGTSTAQDDELYNVLLRASAWADDHAGGNGQIWFGAHTVTEQVRTRITRHGQVLLHPADHPVRQINGLAYGADFQNLTALSSLSQVWIEDNRGLVVSILPFRGTFSSIEFGAISQPGGEMFIQYQYVAGYACTQLASSAAQGASQIIVNDATGFVPPATSLVGNLQGSVARIWDPGLEEAVTVGSSYTAGSATIPLASNLVNAHNAGTFVSELPADVRQAVICYAVGLLMRDDVTEDEPFSRTPYGPTARRSKSGGKAGGLVGEAEKLLHDYKRVR